MWIPYLSVFAERSILSDCTCIINQIKISLLFVKKLKQIVPTNDAGAGLNPIYHKRTERLTISQDLYIFVRQNFPTL
jgi:hypothetical protein